MEAAFVHTRIHGKGNIGQDIFEKAYCDYFSRLELYAASLLDEENATDVVQDIFVYMWDHIDDFKRCNSVYAYLRRMVYCLCIDQIRHNRIVEKYISEQLYVSDVSRDDVDITVSYRELDSQYKKILEQMPPKRRDVFILQQSTNLSLLEISRRMNISVKTVDCHLANARKTLRQKLIQFQLR